MRLPNAHHNNLSLDPTSSRLAQIGREILDIAAGRTEIRTTVTHQPGGVITTRTEVHPLNDDASDARHS